jgi:hypothetical protein
MIDDYQKKLAKMANRHMNKIFEKDTDAYNNAMLLVTLFILDSKPILEQMREDVDIINLKIKEND